MVTRRSPSTENWLTICKRGVVGKGQKIMARGGDDDKRGGQWSGERIRQGEDDVDEEK